jgi:hypothetical protein
MSINLAKSTSCCYFYIMKDNHTPPEVVPEDEHEKAKQSALKKQNKEIGGPSGLEPTRYGDWERKGRCVDF